MIILIYNILEETTMNNFNELPSNSFSTVTYLRNFIHFYISQSDNIYQLLSFINESLDPFGVTFDSSCMSINIKIKKTSLRSDSKFDNSATWYYRIINPILSKFFSDRMIVIGSMVETNGKLYNLEYKDLKY